MVIAMRLILFAIFCVAIDPAAAQDRQIQNLRAFTKLYGYTKYFHPSDAASRIDWDRFAIYGCERVKNAKSNSELKTVLEELFHPIGPTVQVFPSDESPEPVLSTGSKNNERVVAWQHLGVGIGGSKRYKSIRTNRENIVANEGAGFGTVTQAAGAAAYRGKKIRLTAYVRTNVSGGVNQGQLWLRVDRENKQMGFFDNMSDRPIKSDEWREYELSGTVADDATQIVFGCFLKGTGQVWTDEFNLQVEPANGVWESIQINNPGFELAVNGKPSMWVAASPGYTYKITDDNPYKGASSLLIENTSILFEEIPEIGEMINKELCEGLSCRVPLALPADDEEAHGTGSKEALDALSLRLDQVAVQQLTADNEAVRLADIVIAWNIFQNFYPYFDVVATDWDAALTQLFEEALADQNEEDFYDTLRKMISMIHDGHGYVYHKLQEEQAGFPFLIDWIESKAVVVFSKEGSGFHIGDIVESIDGVPADKVLAEEEKFISGSPQWRRVNALHRFGHGLEGTTAKVLIKRKDQTLEIEAARDNKEFLTEPAKVGIEEIEEGIFYVNLYKTEMPEITARIEELANAKGVIFDLRGYPKGNHEVISHLLTESDTSSAWMRVPHIIYPDRENISGYSNHGWFLPAKKPHIKGKVVFITDGRAISYAESYMSFIEHYQLADIVGQPTAGTNGNVNAFDLPGGFRVSWTGMKVVKHDGSQHHLVGILPTVPAERTVQGVLEGRDEFLEKALEILEGNSYD